LIVMSRLNKFILPTVVVTLIVCLTVNAAPVNAAPVALTATEDTYITVGGMTGHYNYGGSPSIFVGDFLGVTYVGLVRFDLSSIPAGSTINSAFLNLYGTGFMGAAQTGRPYNVLRVTESWVEGTANGATETGSCDWFDREHGTLSWTNAGGTSSSEHFASASVPPAPGLMTWTVTDIVKDWIEGGKANYGFMITDGGPGPPGGATDFASSETTAPDPKPLLEIDYSPPRPVGGYFVPVNKLAILAPYLALVSLVGAVTLAVATPRRRKP